MVVYGIYANEMPCNNELLFEGPMSQLQDSNRIPTSSHMDVDEKLKDLLYSKCPDNAVGTYCAYVYDLYVSREKCME